MRSRLVPVGPVVRWTPGKTAKQAEGGKGVESARDDWASGRSFAEEEKRCGLLATVGSSLLQANNKSSPGSKPTTSDNHSIMRHRRLNCVIKTQCSDWQINEIDGEGSNVSITQRPKGRWKKIRRGKTILIEEDSLSEFHSPGKTYAEKSLDFGAYKKIEGAIAAGHPLLRFSMYKEAYSTDAVVDRLFYEARIPKDAVLFTEELDGFGCVSQLGTGIGVAKHQLPHASKHYSFNSLIFNPLSSMSITPENIFAPIRGCHFKALLRCVNVNGQQDVDEQIVERLSTFGFVNYFPVTVFSGCENSTFDILRATEKGDTFAACGMWLQSEAERNPIMHEHFLKYLAADESTIDKTLESWIIDMKRFRSFSAVTSFLSALREGGPAMLGDEKALKANLLPLVPSWHRYENSAPMFVWNAMASQRLISHGYKVVVGDVVRVRGASAEGEDTSQGNSLLGDCDPQVTFEYRLVETEDDVSKYNVDQVVLPVPKAGSLSQQKKSDVMFPRNAVNKELYRTFATAHSFNSLVSSEQETLGALEYRPLIVRPEGLKAVAVRDPNSYSALKSDLFLKQEMKSPTLGVEDRLRNPCKFNTSPRLMEKLSPILKKHGSSEPGDGGAEYSVALECHLPRGAHMLSMLREVFDVHHGTYHDVLSPTTIQFS